MKKFREAEDWFLDERNDEIFSFVSICEQLGINPKYLRQGLLRWKQKKLAATPATVPRSTTSADPGEAEEIEGQTKAKPEFEAGPDALALYLQEVRNIPRLSEEQGTWPCRQSLSDAKSERGGCAPLPLWNRRRSPADVGRNRETLFHHEGASPTNRAEGD